MARWEFKLPDIGEGVTEGEIVSWLIKPGEMVKEDQPMVEVMTDKATVTITSPRAGAVVETRGTIGHVVQVHEVLVVFEVDGAGAAAAPEAKNGASPDGPAATAVGDIKESLPGLGAPSPRRGTIPVGPPAPSSAYFNEKPLATPATRKLARDLEVDLKVVPPTGPSGRVTKTDVESFAQNGTSGSHTTPVERRPITDLLPPPPHGAPAATTTQQAPPNDTRGRDAVRITAPTKEQGALEERVPFAGMRRKIATKMAQSKHTAAHFTFVEECEVTALKALRARLKGPAEKEGVKLSFLPFIVKAVVAALKKHPVLNSALESTQRLVYRKYFNIGIAVVHRRRPHRPGGEGLRPPQHPGDRPGDIRLSDDAKAGKSKIEDLGGSTFTITSLGAQGGLFATPIINFPEVASSAFTR